MKKSMFTLVCAAVFMAGFVYAEGLKGTGTYGSAGCGLGSMLFVEKNGKVQQVLAATTNGTFGTQTFGISSGTSNCTSEGMAKLDKEKEIFVEVNYATLQKEIAQANGETLASFASLMGCSEDAQVLFAKTLQKNTATLNSIDNGTQFISVVKNTVNNDAVLAEKCSVNG
ncbi:MAG TPA: DUF3015 family protein [Oligoflexia bacterium]|nr:DUF3015 family protein [Oligoflexia bacterium]HMR23725.1 DUF3015 family protein [Oligoflexia bacterium]